MFAVETSFYTSFLDTAILSEIDWGVTVMTGALTTGRQYRKEDDPSSVQLYADEFQIEVEQILKKCTDLSHEAIKLAEEIIQKSETAHGILYR